MVYSGTLICMLIGSIISVNPILDNPAPLDVLDLTITSAYTPLDMIDLCLDYEEEV